jgi:hypothetical protein
MRGEIVDQLFVRLSGSYGVEGITFIEILSTGAVQTTTVDEGQRPDNWMCY